MGTEAVFLCIIAILLFAIAFGIVGMIVYSKKQSVNTLDDFDNVHNLEKKQTEFTKKVMMILLAMWVLGGFVSLWMVCCNPSIEMLELVQRYIQYPVTVGVTMYGFKSGAENCSKISASKELPTLKKLDSVQEVSYDE